MANTRILQSSCFATPLPPYFSWSFWCSWLQANMPQLKMGTKSVSMKTSPASLRVSSSTGSSGSVSQSAEVTWSAVTASNTSVPIEAQPQSLLGDIKDEGVLRFEFTVAWLLANDTMELESLSSSVQRKLKGNGKFEKQGCPCRGLSTGISEGLDAVSIFRCWPSFFSLSAFLGAGSFGSDLAGLALSEADLTAGLEERLSCGAVLSFSLEGCGFLIEEVASCGCDLAAVVAPSDLVAMALPLPFIDVLTAVPMPLLVLGAFWVFLVCSTAGLARASRLDFDPFNVASLFNIEMVTSQQNKSHFTTTTT